MIQATVSRNAVRQRMDQCRDLLLDITNRIDATGAEGKQGMAQAEAHQAFLADIICQLRNKRTGFRA
jgi:uncharacterized protein involved in exopolysaccharide biosynthesis